MYCWGDIDWHAADAGSTPKNATPAPAMAVRNIWLPGMSSVVQENVSQLIEMCNKDKPLSESDIEVVRLLISAGADVNAVGS